MSFKKYFYAAHDHLKAIGLAPEIRSGQRLLVQDVKDLESELGRPLPQELTEYFLELGDGFAFLCGHPKRMLVAYWGIPPLAEMLSCWSCIHDEAVSVSKGENDYVHDGTEECRREASKRLHWLPIENLSGTYICIDMACHPSPIRYHNKYWAVGTGASEGNSMILAPSLRDYIRMWSRFCFSEPVIDGHPLGLGSYVDGKEGVFDWDPSRFSPRYDRGTTEA